MVVKHLLVEERNQGSGLRRVEPEPVRRTTTSHPVLFFVVGHELLGAGVLVHDADAGQLEAVQDGRVDLQGHAVSPQVEVVACVEAQRVGDRLQEKKSIC